MSESRATAGVTRDIVQKLWRLCDILRDDGITYQAYVTELTYLLFLKMLAETEREGSLPTDARWASLTSRQGEALLTHYRALLRSGRFRKCHDISRWRCFVITCARPTFSASMQRRVMPDEPCAVPPTTNCGRGGS